MRNIAMPALAGAIALVLPALAFAAGDDKGTARPGPADQPKPGVSESGKPAGGTSAPARSGPSMQKGGGCGSFIIR